MKRKPPMFTQLDDGKVQFLPFDAQITAVRIAGDYTRRCPKCDGVQRLELRQTADGVVRDQPRCCRNGASKSLRSHQPQGLTEKEPGSGQAAAARSPEPELWQQLSWNWNAGFGPYPKVSKPFPEGTSGAARLRAESEYEWPDRIDTNDDDEWP